jgi:putative SOS response-associated peptidase YedK
MCGRFTLALSPQQLELAFPWLAIPPELTPSYNIAPSQRVAVVPNKEERRVELIQWGLIPHRGQRPEDRQPDDQRAM